MMIRTFATVVMVRAIIKAENMTDQHAPETRTMTEGLRRECQNRAPRTRLKYSDRTMVVKKLRQKVSSKP